MVSDATTSNQRVFNLDVDEIIDEAISMIGGEHVSGVENKKARRTLNLLLIELQNKGVPINTLDFITVNGVKGQLEYSLPTEVVDVYELNLKRDDIETPLLRYSLQEFHQIPTKDQQDRPSTYTVERNTDTPAIKVWPRPDRDTDEFELMVYKKIEDVTTSYQKIGLAHYYLPAVTTGLAYKLSLKRTGVDQYTKERIRQDYLEILQTTFDEDRERTPMKIRPRGVGVWTSGRGH